MISEGFCKKVLVVVPAYNEGASIRAVAESLDREGFDYVVINDGSVDDTAAILDSCRIPHIDLIENLGIGGYHVSLRARARRHAAEGLKRSYIVGLAREPG